MADSGRLDELQRKFDENPRRYFAPLANEFRKGGDAVRAIELCRTYLPHLPGHMSGYIVYGQALFDADRGEEAAHVFQEALRIDPENVIALRHLGDIARQKGEGGIAIQWYERVLELDPKNEELQACIVELQDAELHAAQDDHAEPEPSTPVSRSPAYAPYEYSDEYSYEYPDEQPAANADVSEPIETTIDAPSSTETTSYPSDSFVSNSVDDTHTTSAEFEESTVVEPSVEGDPAVPFVTETLANLYMEQGLYNEALSIYRQLADTRDDPAIHNRVQELEALLLVQQSQTFETSTDTSAETSGHEESTDIDDPNSHTSSPVDPFTYTPLVTSTTIATDDVLIAEVPFVTPSPKGGAGEDPFDFMDFADTPAIKPRVKPAVTVRDFFAAIGARRLPPDPSDLPAHSLAHVFPDRQGDDTDLEAARSLADAYSYGSLGSPSGANSQTPSARPL